MDQHAFRRQILQAFKAEASGVLALITAAHRVEQGQPRDCVIVQRPIVTVDNDPHRVHRRMLGKSAGAVIEQSTARQGQILLGLPGAEAVAASGSDD